MKRWMPALLLSSSLACSPSAGSEDAAYDLVKSKATKDLSCDDVTVRKMSESGRSYEYQATGCSDLYTYEVECGGGCEIVAGVRGRGLGGLWNEAGKLIDGVAQEHAEVKQRQEEMRERHREMRERHDRQMEEIDALRRRGTPGR